MVNYRTVSVIFVVLTIIFAVSTSYLIASPNTVTQTTTTTQTTTQSAVQTITQTTTQTTTQITTQTAIQTTTQTTVQTITSPQSTVGVAFKSPIGAYLTNGSGWTLYLFTIDVPNNGTSACYGQCAQFWPPFYISNLKAPPGLNASLFGTITRTDGSKQLTYNGYPLYYFASDKQAGDTAGQGAGGVWFAYSLPEPKTK